MRILLVSFLLLSVAFGQIEELRKAAEQGLAKAQFNLGASYLTGAGVPQDYVEAYKWSNLASAMGDETAKKLKEDLTKRMTKEQIVEAQKLSREWMEKREKKE